MSVSNKMHALDRRKLSLAHAPCQPLSIKFEFTLKKLAREFQTIKPVLNHWCDLLLPDRGKPLYLPVGLRPARLEALAFLSPIKRQYWAMDLLLQVLYLPSKLLLLQQPRKKIETPVNDPRMDPVFIASGLHKGAQTIQLSGNPNDKKRGARLMFNRSTAHR